MKKNITIITGDGVGPDVTYQSIKVLDAIGNTFNHVFHFEYGLMGAVAIEKLGTPLPEDTLTKAKDSDAVLFGAIGHPKYDNDPYATMRPEQGLMSIRKELDLYCNIRPVHHYPALHLSTPIHGSTLKDVDFVIFRELTGGIYFGNKHTSEDGNTATDECSYSVTEIERVAHLAFQHAQQRRKKLTLIDRANVLETSRLWRKVIQRLATFYGDVAVNYMYMDNALRQIILNPKQFDVVLSDNMFGDLLSAEASILYGSLGLAPSASIGDKSAMFGPVHGSFPQAAGKDIANPIGSILSTAMMLDFFGMVQEAKVIREAVQWTLNNRFVTKDIDPINFYFTSTVGDLISEYVQNKITGGVNFENIELRKSTVI